MGWGRKGIDGPVVEFLRDEGLAVGYLLGLLKGEKGKAERESGAEKE